MDSGIPGDAWRFFEEIVCSDRCYAENGLKKRREMRALAKHRKIELKHMLSIGDRYETDIRPAVEFGGMGIQVQGPADLMKICAALNSHSETCPNFPELRVRGL